MFGVTTLVAVAGGGGVCALAIAYIIVRCMCRRPRPKQAAPPRTANAARGAAAGGTVQPPKLKKGYSSLDEVNATSAEAPHTSPDFV